MKIKLFLFPLLAILCAAVSGFAQIIKNLPVTQVPIGNDPVLVPCPGLTATLRKQNEGHSPCCYQLSIENAWQPATAPYSLTLELKSGDITNVYGTPSGWQQAPAAVPPQVKKVVWSRTPNISGGKTNLASVCLRLEKPTWVHFTWLDRAGKTLCRDSTLMADCLFEPENACKTPLIRNEGFAPSTLATQPPAFWAKGYGSPKFLDTPGGGCFDPGYVELSGNQTNGDAITQALDPTKKLLKGKKYVLQVAVKFNPISGGPNYCRLRAVAWRNTLGFSGLHPKPSADVAIIGRSGKIKACNNWSIVEFPVWTANQDFQMIGISAFTDDNAVSKIWIDNVTLCETGLSGDCDEITINAAENPLPPPGFGPLPTNLGCPVVAEPEEVYNNGSLQDLYGQLYQYNGTTNWYSQAGDKCFSIGGTIPPEALKYNCDDSLKMMGINMTCEQLKKALDNPDLSGLSNVKPPPLPVIPAPQNGTCTVKPPANFVEMPFKGRDIVFIHGLQLSHLCDRANGIAGAQANWPDPNTRHEFLTGYYKAVAMGNFGPHIQQYIHNPGHKNRYIVVTYNCSQSAEIAAHSVLAQIREAMENNNTAGIVSDPSDPRGTSCFGREYVFVSHSTGALIADIALSIAHMTKTNPTMKAKWGDIGLLSDRCKGRVSFRGAFTGSHLATLLVAFQSTPTLSRIASGILTKGVCKKDFSSAADRNMVLNSVLVDLVPSVAQARWGIYLQSVPVPVLDISSAHPTAITPFLKFSMHPGYDDGVLTMDCSGSNMALHATQPSRFAATSARKVFDMGQPIFRAVTYYRDQFIAPTVCAASNTPYLSPTGMVQPVAAVLAPAVRYANHYSFVQSTSEHWLEKSFWSGNYEQTSVDKSRNWEEELVVENPMLFSSGIVDPGIASQMTENIKEKVVYYPTLRIKTVKGIPRPIIVWKKFYIWKRTYHVLQEPNWYDYDYAYRYLFRN